MKPLILRSIPGAAALVAAVLVSLRLTSLVPDLLAEPELLMIVLIPSCIAAIPLFAGGRSSGYAFAAVLLAPFMYWTAMSVGRFYLPVLLLLVVGIVVGRTPWTRGLDETVEGGSRQWGRGGCV